jgi:hypothetical protein
VQHAGKSFQHFHLTKGDVQVRCNLLTRELHTAGAAGHILEESQNKKNGGRVTQQAKIESYFSRPPGKAKAKVQNGIKPAKRHTASPSSTSKDAARRGEPEQACYSDVEVVEAPYRSNSVNGPTKHEDGGPSKKAKAKSSSTSSHSSFEQIYSDCEIIESPPSTTNKGTTKDDIGESVCFDVEELPVQKVKGKRKDPGGDASASSSSCSEKKPRAS